MTARTLFKLTLILPLCFSGIFQSSIAQAGLHKWVDEHGQTHYGDRIPPKYLKKQHSTLSEQGVVIRQKEASKTDEEILQEKKDRQLKAETDKQRLIEQRKQALRDRVLLDTFTTEKDLEIARDTRIDSIDSQLSLAETLIKNDEKKLADAKKRISDIEKSGRQAPKNLHKVVTSVSKQLEVNYSYIEDKNNERENILKNFDSDVSRFRELKANKSKQQSQR